MSRRLRAVVIDTATVVALGVLLMAAVSLSLFVIGICVGLVWVVAEVARGSFEPWL